MIIILKGLKCREMTSLYFYEVYNVYMVSLSSQESFTKNLEHALWFDYIELFKGLSNDTRFFVFFPHGPGYL